MIIFNVVEATFLNVSKVFKKYLLYTHSHSHNKRLTSLQTNITGCEKCEASANRNQDNNH